MTEIQSKKQDKLNKIKVRIEKKLECPLKDSATNVVFGKGNPDAEILFIGEAPGNKEDLEGIPFVGAAGKRLDKLLNSIGLDLNDIYIANVLKYRPPKNRDPTLEEVRKHTPFLIEQIDVIKPKVIATLGNWATKFILSHFEVDEMKKIAGIAQIHGEARILEIKGREYNVIPLYHPAAMIYRPQLREVLEKDFQKIKTIISM